MTTKGRNATKKFKSMRSTNQLSNVAEFHGKTMFKSAKRVNPVKGSRRGSRR